MTVEAILELVDGALGMVGAVLRMAGVSPETSATASSVIGVARAGLREALERDVVLRGTADGVPGVARDLR